MREYLQQRRDAATILQSEETSKKRKRTHLEPRKRLVPTLIAINHADRALSTRPVGRGVVEPERLPEVLFEDRHGQDGGVRPVGPRDA